MYIWVLVLIIIKLNHNYDKKELPESFEAFFFKKLYNFDIFLP